MNSDHEGADEELLKRWNAASGRAARLPLAELLARGRQRTGSRSPRGVGRRLATATAVVAVVAVAVAGAGAWISYRTSALPAGTASATPAANRTAPLPSPSGTAQLPSIALGEHEYVIQMQRTGAGGWVLTSGRLLLNDGKSWRVCWQSPTGNTFSPNLAASIAADSIHIVNRTTLWSGTTACSGWTQVELPLAPTSLDFATPQVGYIADGSNSDTVSDARIYRTDDAGLHWAATAATVKTGRGLYGSLPMSFVDAEHGWITDNQTLWYTANGGRAWSVTHLQVPASVRLRFDSVMAPVVGADGSATVVAKYDGSPGMDGAVGQRVFYRTTDAGAHWGAAAVIADSGMLALSLADPTTWVVRDGTVFRATADAGATWQATTVRSGHPADARTISILDSISFSDPGHGWLVYSDPDPPCAKNAICDWVFAPPQHVVATDDGGANWHEVLP